MEQRDRATTFAITDAKHCVPVVLLSTQNNVELLEQLKLGFKRTFNWNKYQSNVEQISQNSCLYHLIDPSFQGVNRLFVFSFENPTDRTAHIEYYLSKAEIKDYNVMIDAKN